MVKKNRRVENAYARIEELDSQFELLKNKFEGPSASEITV